MAFADDLTLFAPDRWTLQRMIRICEEYGKQHNLVFSTDPNPSKSKTKCVLFCGRKNFPTPPAVMLDEKALPWVESADHLGHKLHQDLSMEMDANKVRGSFMSRANDVRDNLYFATAEQRMQAIQLYCCDAYGSMLWELNMNCAERYFKAWNIQARLAWNVPRDTHTNLVENYFCSGHMSLRRQIFSRYQNFLRKLETSPSKEIRIMIGLVREDQRSVTGRNIQYLSRLCDYDILKYDSCKVNEMLPNLTACETWRLSLLSTLLDARMKGSFTVINITKQAAQEMINSLCNS